MSEVRGDGEKYVRRTRACRPKESLRSTRSRLRATRIRPTRDLSKGDGLKSEDELRSMFVSASVASRSSHGNLVSYRPQPDIQAKDHTPLWGKCDGGRRSSRAAETAQRGPRCIKTTQCGLPAYRYKYPVVVESSRGYKLGNRVQPGATARAG